MSSTEPTVRSEKYDADFNALEESFRWLQHINLRRHRGNDEVRAQVKAARRAIADAIDSLLEVERADMAKAPTDPPSGP